MAGWWRMKACFFWDFTGKLFFLQVFFFLMYSNISKSTKKKIASNIGPSPPGSEKMLTWSKFSS